MSKKNAAQVEVLESLVGGQSKWIDAYQDVERKDEQASQLLYEVWSKLSMRLSLDRGEQEAFLRLHQVIENADRWDAGLLRNNIFKAAQALGIKLPSMIFASDELSQAQQKLAQLQETVQQLAKQAGSKKIKKDLKLTTGDVIPKGASVEVKFLGRSDPKGYNTCMLEVDFTGPSGRDYQRQPMRTSISRLPDQVDGFKTPSMRMLEKWSEDGVCLTPTGKRVEPDGYGPDGSPSWLLAMGMI